MRLTTVSQLDRSGNLDNVRIIADATSNAAYQPESQFEPYELSLRRAATVTEQQTKVVHQLHGLQSNFDSIVQEELARIRDQHESLIHDATSDREAAAQELTSAQDRVRQAEDDAKVEVERFEKASSAISQRYLSEVRKGIKSKLNSNNYHRMLELYEKAVEFCGKKGHPVEESVYETVKAELKEDYAEAVRKEVQRAEVRNVRTLSRARDRVAV